MSNYKTSVEEMATESAGEISETNSDQESDFVEETSEISETDSDQESDFVEESSTAMLSIKGTTMISVKYI